MSVDLSTLINFLSAISSIAVILGAIFVVFQLRQNAKLIQLTIRENRSNIALALLEKITDESFPVRRKKMHDVVRAAGANDWREFDGSLDDYEARNFAYIYELIGQLTRDGTVDITMIRNALQYLVVFDWDAFAPLSKHLMDVYKLNANPWGNFEWLADETRKYMAQKQQASTGGKPAMP
jgi:hypothetical protein